MGRVCVHIFVFACVYAFIFACVRACEGVCELKCAKIDVRQFVGMDCRGRAPPLKKVV